MSLPKPIKSFEAEMLECLQRIEAAVSSDEYEQLSFWTVGGGNGTYILKSPVNTEAEWSIFGLSATAACNLLISNNPASNKLAIDGSVNYGSGGGNENNALEGMFLVISAATIIPPTVELCWQPCGRGSSIYVLISGLAGSQAAFLNVVWRRKLNRAIPGPLRSIPSTHSQRQSHRNRRVLPAESTQVQGYEEQYPVPGAGYYHHAVVPTASDPTAAFGEAVGAHPTQAELVLARLRGMKLRGSNQ